MDWYSHWNFFAFGPKISGEYQKKSRPSNTIKIIVPKGRDFSPEFNSGFPVVPPLFPPMLSLRSSFGGQGFNPCWQINFVYSGLKKSVSKRIKTTFTDSAFPTSRERHQLAHGYGGGRASTHAEATLSRFYIGTKYAQSLRFANNWHLTVNC